MVAFVVYDLV